MTYDADRQRVVLFGGFQPETDRLLSDHWEYDGAWVERPLATAPSERDGHAMAYDLERGRIVLFGGLARMGMPTSYSQDTWEYFRP